MSLLGDLIGINDDVIELQGRTGGLQTLREEVQQGTGILSLQGLRATDITIEGAASGVQIVISTNSVDVITLLIAGLGALAEADAGAPVADSAPAQSAAYVQADVQAILTELRALKTSLRNADIIAT